MKKFKWKWCDHCDSACIICPGCGNNCCNAEQKCDICPLAYQFQELSCKANAQSSCWFYIPETKEAVDEFNRNIESK